MRDGIDEFGETAPYQADLIAIEEAREAWALTRSHGASDDPLSPPTPQNWGIYGVLRRAWDVAAGIWGSNPALICPYDDSGPSVRLVGCLNARVGCCYHEMLFLPDFLKTAIQEAAVVVLARTRGPGIVLVDDRLVPRVYAQARAPAHSAPA